eukprot:Sdes_comp14173_c0_seq2m3407
MFKKNFNGNQLKVQLKLAINRLKMLRNKRGNQQAVQRKEIANLLEKGKDESARIKVEHIIREDFFMEAMDILELYCELLLARFGLIENMKYCDAGIQEAVSTLIWASPRVQNDLREFSGIRDQLILKYGKDFGMDVMENKDSVVNERIIHKLSIQTPDSYLVSQVIFCFYFPSLIFFSSFFQYLEVIAKSHNVNWVPPVVEFSTSFSDSLLIEKDPQQESKSAGLPFATSSSQTSPPPSNLPPTSTSCASLTPISCNNLSAASAALREPFGGASNSNSGLNPIGGEKEEEEDFDFDDLSKRFEA